MNQRYVTTTAYYLAFILLGLTIAAEGPTLLKLAEHTSSALDQISSLFLFGSLGYLLGSYVGGRLYDRVPGHRFMAAVLIFLGIMVALVPLASSRWVLFTVALILGLFKGALDVGCNTLLLWVHNEAVGPFMNGLHAFFGVGAFIAPLIVARVIAATGDIYWVYWIFAIAALPLAIWTLSAFFREIPWDLDKAARVDGATPFQAFWHVIAPLAAPGVFTAAILVFIFAWNDFLFAISLTSTNAARTVPAAIAFFTGASRYELPTGSIAAASVVVTVPVILLVLVFQRRIVAGLTAGAVKG